jgi:hypothetical protein
VNSLTARGELRRTEPLLARWPGRDDVAEVRRRLGALARPASPTEPPPR